MDNPTSVAVARPRARALPRVNISKVLLYAILTLAALAFLMPFYWTVTSSVKVTSEVRQVPPTWWPHSFTLDHYRRVLWRPTFFRYMLNSLIYAGGTAGIVLKLTREVISEGDLTVLMVTHNMDQAISMGDRLLMMNQGRVILDVTGEAKSNLTVAEVMELFSRARGEVYADDRSLLT